ncbi:hypothetical protein OBBRIDRAFT_727028, partial [Obba rivulosa]
VYVYVNPKTGEQVTSLLPPTHPEMICQQDGQPLEYTKYGRKGIISAVCFFPIGIWCYFIDLKVR